jgi:glycerophosphoryl diester phosphodiesterase
MHVQTLAKITRSPDLLVSVSTSVWGCKQTMERRFMLVIAHRGANQEAIENSWAAMENAIAGGSQRIELDVQLSLDGVPFIFHDDTLVRLCGIHRDFSALHSRELGTIHLADGSKIPRGDQVVDKILPRVELNLEIKGSATQTAEAIACLVAASPYAERVVFSSFYPEPLRYLRAHYPQLSCAMLWGYDSLEINPLYFSSPQYLMSYGDCQIIHPQVALVTPHFMEQARYRGWRVYPWISLSDETPVQRVAIWQQLRDLGVDGFCTNWPREFCQWQHELQ